MKRAFQISVCVIFASYCAVANADLATSWDIGEKVPNFSALAIDPLTQDPFTTQWYGETGADVYIVSTCAMWCGPCQQFAIDSQILVQDLAAEGIDAEVYDFIFQDIGAQEPDEIDAQQWIENVWTSVPENVWFGGQISTLANDSVTTDIFEAAFNAGGSGQAIPAIAILDRNFVVRDLLEGYSPAAVAAAARSAASIPEPGTLGVLCAIGTCMFLRSRTRPVH